MKDLLNLKKIAAGLFFVLAFTACSDDDDDTAVPVVETNTIADFVASNDNYSSLAAALEVAGLTATLDGTQNYTVFAPDNDAFAAFLSDNGFSTLADVPVDLLTQVLLNHVQMGEIMAADLSTGYIESMATGSASEENLSMYISTENGVMINGVATVTAADIEVDNGIIHAVDEVIGLPSVVTFALADPTFNSLVAALTREDDFTFVSTLMETGSPAPFTVFAPTNEAFAALLGELELNSLNDIPEDVLASVLSYHVVAGANVRSSALTDDMEVSTLLGQSFTIDLDNGAVITDASGRTANIIVVDVQANNGVVHVLDTVLLPAM
ncbi:fasciclin domain-containing protein [Salinimicrobium sp. MT39]|uniref:Fasciclin domain-containing protein n=1 Tax=Salinimicrobium profundisediminis TaxID=2994553 RepID=A0A9X3I2J2_9FLAO|nr:fasciclin domain-containing protein [Salinimicrobium profundisediminis]MCX2839017.1 fasciclin domain-containing protein [Salinimicrobium profundisediminis]